MNITSGCRYSWKTRRRLISIMLETISFQVWLI